MTPRVKEYRRAGVTIFASIMLFHWIMNSIYSPMWVTQGVEAIDFFVLDSMNTYNRISTVEYKSSIMPSLSMTLTDIGQPGSSTFVSLLSLL